MKNRLFFCLSVLLFSGCTSDKNDIIDEVSDLVPATIGIGFDQPAETRSFLGKIDGTTVPHLFEKNDQILLVDRYGQHSFTIDSDGTSTTMSGSWGDPKKYPNLCAMHPFSAARGTNPVELTADNQPTMHFTLPTTQESRDLAETSQSKDSGISYDQTAGLAFACQESKGFQVTFIPVVSFLYFYSKEEYCTIESTVNIAGDYDVTYLADEGTNSSDTEYSTAGGIWQNNYMSIKASSKTITCKGKKIAVHKDKVGDYYEYIIALKPGTYSEHSLKIIPQGNTTSHFSNLQAVTFIPSYLYYIGSVDAASNASASGSDLPGDGGNEDIDED